MNRLEHLLPGKVQRGLSSGSVGGLRSLGLRAFGVELHVGL